MLVFYRVFVSAKPRGARSEVAYCVCSAERCWWHFPLICFEIYTTFRNHSWSQNNLKWWRRFLPTLYGLTIPAHKSYAVLSWYVLSHMNHLTECDGIPHSTKHPTQYWMVSLYNTDGILSPYILNTHRCTDGIPLAVNISTSSILLHRRSSWWV